MKRLIINVKAKDTLLGCITVTPTSLSGSVVKNQDYTGSSVQQFVLAVKNNCNTSFELPAQILFSESADTSTFKGRVNTHTLTANQTVNVPILFDGIFKKNASSYASSFTIGGTTVSVFLAVTVNDTPGVISTITKTINNRTVYTLQPVDFTSAYTDVDGDTIVSVKLYGDVSKIRLNGATITANQVIPMADITANKLTVIATDTNDAFTYSLNYSIVDSKGNTIN